jgi:hypothetical protein
LARYKPARGTHRTPLTGTRKIQYTFQ